MLSDKYRKARGGWSRILSLNCENCKQHICDYQKDGPGPLKRLYLDRMHEYKNFGDNLTCPHCSELLGTKTIYKKENRPAYRLYVGAIEKSVVKK